MPPLANCKFVSPRDNLNKLFPIPANKVLPRSNRACAEGKTGTLGLNIFQPCEGHFETDRPLFKSPAYNSESANTRSLAKDPKRLPTVSHVPVSGLRCKDQPSRAAAKM